MFHYRNDENLDDRLDSRQILLRHHYDVKSPIKIESINNDDQRRIAFYSGLWHMDRDVIEFNYYRLKSLLDRFTRHRMNRFNLRYYEARIDELDYTVAFEFFLQFDVHVFYMKTCGYRKSMPLSYNLHLFTRHDPLIRYGMSACQTLHCRLCFPEYKLTYRSEKHPCRFDSHQCHRFVNGLEVILNCPVTCTDTNLIYALTCPCGRVDYVGESSSTLDSRLKCNHRAIVLYVLPLKPFHSRSSNTWQSYYTRILIGS